jgi:CheY-like chemotaxis protein
MNDMPQRILSVFGSRDHLAPEVMSELFRELGAGIELESSAASAQQRYLRDPNYDLIITHVNIPVDSSSTDAKERQGLDFLQSLDTRGSKIPSLVVVPSLTGDVLTKANELSSNCYVLDLSQKGESWKDELIRRCKLVLDRKSYLPEIKAVNVDISVAAERRPAELWDVSFKVVGGDPVEASPLPIEVDSRKVERLINRSKLMQELHDRHPQWEWVLRDIGEELGEILLQNADFRKRFLPLFTMAGGREKFRIRFKVKRSAHPVILEALAERQDDDRWEYWMLKSPIYRDLWTDHTVTVYQPPLFQGDVSAPYNCLIIKSNLDSNYYIEPLGEELGPLTNVEREASILQERLTGKGTIGKVVTLPPKNEICTTELVKEWLTEKGPWHIVHYAGHSFHREKGYFVFPTEQEPKWVSSEKMSAWLRPAKTGFIYLSSCHSSEADFLYELASYGIPSALGFRWAIRDDLAEEHAKIFYEHLLRCRSLEYAFFYTRRDMHDQHFNEIIWAAPVLIMQIRDDLG